MVNLWDKVRLHLSPDMVKVLRCLRNNCEDCIDLDDPKFDSLCGKQKCKLEYILRKYCGVNCKCA